MACNRLLLMILLDAFRPDYVARTRWLARWAQRCLRGSLREPFGFSPRPSYFGGLRPEEARFTHLFYYDPHGSPFGVASGLEWIEEKAPSLIHQAREWITQVARERVPSFTAAYLSTLEIPIRLLPFFAPAERYAPWDPKVGYNSLFRQLEAKGLLWLECSWPLSTRLPRSDDTGIVDHVLRQLRPEHRLAYVHLQQLDALGHIYGPGSFEVQRGIEEIDRLVRRLIEHCQKLFNKVDVLIWGDHGMVRVVHSIDVWKLLDESGLRLGDDFVYFLDSTMARFWFPRRSAQDKILELLTPLREGVVLQQEDLKRLHIAQCDPRNGELIFLLHPGVVIVPNFFQRSSHLVKGMHGYDPECPDNMGIFLLYTDDMSPGEIPPIDAWQIYFTALELLQLPGPREHSALHMERLPQRGRYTQTLLPHADTVIERHLDLIATEIQKACPDMTALLLVGGFGRGEGGVYQDEDGQIRPVNDFDLIALGTQSNLKPFGQALAAHIGIDYVDIVTLKAYQPSESSPSLFDFDCVYGSQLLWGSPETLAWLPKYAPAQIPLAEGVKLLFNRIAGLLIGLKDFGKHKSLNEAQRKFLSNQIIKALIAIGDWYLLEWADYNTLYALRRERFASLASAYGLPSGSIEHVQQAYSFKIAPDYSKIQIDEWLYQTKTWILDTLIHAVGVMTHSEPSNLIEAMTIYHDARKSKEDNLECLQRSTGKSWANSQEIFTEGVIGIRPTLYVALALLLAALQPDTVDSFYLTEGSRWLSRLITLPPWHLDSEGWEVCRTHAVALWEELCH
ncbi:MAG: alkaline phosphatase family protein [Candidatus Caldarchaeum sp.]